jgi:hypothetical protein
MIFKIVSPKNKKKIGQEIGQEIGDEGSNYCYLGKQQ